MWYVFCHLRQDLYLEGFDPYLGKPIWCAQSTLGDWLLVWCRQQQQQCFIYPPYIRERKTILKNGCRTVLIQMRQFFVVLPLYCGVQAGSNYFSGWTKKLHCKETKKVKKTHSIVQYKDAEHSSGWNRINKALTGSCCAFSGLPNCRLFEVWKTPERSGAIAIRIFFLDSIILCWILTQRNNHLRFDAWLMTSTDHLQCALWLKLLNWSTQINTRNAEGI